MSIDDLTIFVHRITDSLLPHSSNFIDLSKTCTLICCTNNSNNDSFISE